MKKTFDTASEQLNQNTLPSQTALMDYLLDVNDITQAEPQKEAILAQLETLVQQAQNAVDQTQPIALQIERLLQLVYQDWAFSYYDDAYHYPADCLLLKPFLAEKQGIDFSLGALVLFLAERLTLPLFPVNFSTQLLLRAELEDEVRLINPLDGQQVDQTILDQWIKDFIGFYKMPKIADLSVADAAGLDTIKSRLAQHLKNGFIREERCDEALRFISHRLNATPNDPYEIRDRGLIMATLGRRKEALADFRFFIEQCPNDPTVTLFADELIDEDKH